MLLRAVSQNFIDVSEMLTTSIIRAITPQKRVIFILAAART
jgi:hypothetical protein